MKARNVTRSSISRKQLHRIPHSTHREVHENNFWMFKLVLTETDSRHHEILHVSYSLRLSHCKGNSYSLIVIFSTWPLDLSISVATQASWGGTTTGLIETVHSRNPWSRSSCGQISILTESFTVRKVTPQGLRWTYLGCNDEERSVWFKLSQGFGYMSTINVGHKPNTRASLGIWFQGFSYHQRALDGAMMRFYLRCKHVHTQKDVEDAQKSGAYQVRATNPNIDHISNRLSSVAFPFAATDSLGGKKVIILYLH